MQNFLQLVHGIVKHDPHLIFPRMHEHKILRKIHASVCMCVKLQQHNVCICLLALHGGKYVCTHE